MKGFIGGRRILLYAGYLLAVVMVLWSLPALAVGIHHIGALLPLCLGLLILAALRWRARLAAWKGAKRGLLRLAAGGLACFFLAFLITSGCMLHAAARPPAEGATLIVAGAQVHGATPSVTLRNRLDAAAEYLKANPEAACVVSGGKGPGEDLSEAEVMAGYLVGQGIDEERIYVEDQSKNTSQNMEYSAKMIRSEGLSTQVAVATDAFHQLRCQMFAQKQGLQPGAVTSKTTWYLWQCYWWREMFGLAKAVVFGN